MSQAGLDAINSGERRRAEAGRLEPFEEDAQPQRKRSVRADRFRLIVVLGFLLLSFPALSLGAHFPLPARHSVTWHTSKATRMNASVREVKREARQSKTLPPPQAVESGPAFPVSDPDLPRLSQTFQTFHFRSPPTA